MNPIKILTKAESLHPAKAIFVKNRIPLRVVAKFIRRDYFYTSRLLSGTVKWLSVYGIRMRPGEMLNIKEKEINLNMGESGAFIIPHPKEKKPKMIYLIDEDYSILKNIPRGLPELYFFRHPKGISGCNPGQKFGDKYLYKWWKRACRELGIENIDLYGGTKHTTVTAASEMLTPEQIKKGTGHSTNKAFERYFQRKERDAVQVYQTINDLQHTYNKKNNQKVAN